MYESKATDNNSGIRVLGPNTDFAYFWLREGLDYITIFMTSICFPCDILDIMGARRTPFRVGPASSRDRHQYIITYRP